MGMVNSDIIYYNSFNCAANSSFSKAKQVGCRIVHGGVVGLSVACGLHYCVNAALIGPAKHYPAIIVDSHADDPDVKDDDYELTIIMDNGEEAEMVVPEKVYEMAMNGESLEICHRKSPFGVVFLDIHMPSAE